MNFGRLGSGGQPTAFAGLALPRDGFRVCRRCGTVQKRGDDGGQHTSTCSARKAEQADVADCLYLYREFRSEAVQMLLPVLDTPGSERRLSSFVAALELGLRRHFSGRIDHLRATTRRSPRRTAVEEPPSHGGGATAGPVAGRAPENGGGAAHQYLLLYDVVPSGTGYLKELMAAPDKLLSVFEKAREALKSCVCNQDPLKDGCYRCVFAYRRSREMAETSRNTAIEMLDRILARKDELEEVPSLGGLTINATFDSELEARFVEALRRVEIDGARAVHVREDLVRGKPGYVLQVGEHTYYMETQADLGASDGVVEPSRPDFLIRPARPVDGQPPVAVFTDGFEFHRAATDADSLKRMALVRAGFLVWSLTWHDLEFVFGKAPDVPDFLAGVKASETMVSLQHELDARWGTAGLRQFRPCDCGSAARPGARGAGRPPATGRDGRHRSLDRNRAGVLRSVHRVPAGCSPAGRPGRGGGRPAPPRGQGESREQWLPPRLERRAAAVHVAPVPARRLVDDACRRRTRDLSGVPTSTRESGSDGARVRSVGRRMEECHRIGRP